jgi:hypothetical protein
MFVSGPGFARASPSQGSITMSYFLRVVRSFQSVLARAVGGFMSTPFAR